MSGLNQKDIEILSHYAEEENRELYWNYISQLPGADGYGALALGVVRNDSISGQVANSYAQSYARSQHDDGSRFPNANLSERQWEEFGQTLLKEDLALRRELLRDGYPDRALNLQGKDVMRAHDQAFEKHSLDPNCWTPRVLLQATLSKSGEQKMEQVWSTMLENDFVGIARAGKTGLGAIAQMGLVDGGAYLGKLTVIELAQLTEGRANTDPNVIGGNSFYSMYFPNEDKWANVSTRGGVGTFQEVTNPARIAELNDARSVRLERQEKSTQFHADDHFRTVTPSPKTLVMDELPGRGSPAVRLADIGPGHPEYPLMQQVREQVAALDAKQGRTFDEFSERMTASVMALARANNLDRADHVVLSAATAEHGPGRNVFVVQGDLNDPAHRRAVMPTQEAVQTPVEQSLQRLEVASADRQQALAQSQQQEVDQQARENPAIRMG